MPRALTAGGLYSLAMGLLFAVALRADERTSSDRVPAAGVKGSFQSGEVDIRFLRFDPPGSGKRPAVILLHGADGWSQLPGYRFAAGGLTTNGQVAILIRFYDRTKTPDQITPKERAEFVGWLKGEAADQKKCRARCHFEAWEETVRDAVAYTRTLANVDRDRVAIAGFSLGGYLAFSSAPACDPPVKAVVEMFGGLPEERRKKLGNLPPTLIVHGDEDDVVSVTEAYKAAGFVLSQKQQTVLEIQKGMGHACCPPGSDKANLAELIKARDLMTRFLNKHLALESRSSARK